ncbi:MAG: LON peptidase substrate-binding domain-containing protein [Acidiferrobacterales bacterium]|nr:LON peptidase substrate-binding domain-containing protein [Acidiferrobacterales bacterium]
MNQRVTSPFTQSFEQLPNSLPIFPLPNALLVPGGRLPLNIFEPRYLNMVRDALKNDYLIGMVQPKPQPKTVSNAGNPAVFEVGCAGRITDYSETEDGRLEIVLSGICRFTVSQEVSSLRGYRMIVPDWQPFAKDYEQLVDPSTEIMDDFNTALKGFLDGHDMPADWELFEKLSVNSLISSLMNVLPLETSERQLLLESENLESRVRAFTAILAGNVSNSQTRH